MEVKDIVKEAIVISTSASFRDVLTRMVHEQANAALVVNGEGKLVGEVSVADLLDGVVPESFDGDRVFRDLADKETFKTAVQSAADRPVEMFMSGDIAPVTLRDSFITVATNAINSGRARIPVVDQDNRPIGIISRRGLKQILARMLDIKES